MKKCPKCGAEVSKTATVCPKCFNFIKLQKEETKHKKCKICGTINDDLATFCVKCKSRLSSVATQLINDSKTFICPKCLSFFGKKDVSKEMFETGFCGSFASVISWSAFLSIFGAIAIILFWFYTTSYNARFDGYMNVYGNMAFSDGALIGVLFFSYIVSFIILILIFGFIYLINSESNNQKKICPVCGRKGNFILSNSKLGMQYVNKKIIEEKAN